MGCAEHMWTNACPKSTSRQLATLNIQAASPCRSKVCNMPSADAPAPSIRLYCEGHASNRTNNTRNSKGGVPVSSSKGGVPVTMVKLARSPAGAGP